MQSKALLPKAQKSWKPNSTVVSLSLIFLLCSASLAAWSFKSSSSELGVGGGKGKILSPRKSKAVPSTSGPASSSLVPPVVNQPSSASSAASQPLELVPGAQQLIQLPPVQPEIEAAPPSGRAQCGDPTNGFEIKVEPCKNYRRPYDLHAVRMTSFSKLQIPLVLDPVKLCAEAVCTWDDSSRCCKPRRTCMEITKDVPNVCPSSKEASRGGRITRPNPYEFAFCQTIPCTAADAEICCIPVTVGPREGEDLPALIGPQSGRDFVWYQGLYERVDPSTSKKSRTAPNDKATYTKFPLSFLKGQVAWFDMSRLVQDGAAAGTEWLPLANFMQSWGPNYGWQEEHFMKFKKDNQLKYRQVHGTMEGEIISWNALLTNDELRQVYS